MSEPTNIAPASPSAAPAAAQATPAAPAAPATPSAPPTPASGSPAPAAPAAPPGGDPNPPAGGAAAAAPTGDNKTGTDTTSQPTNTTPNDGSAKPTAPDGQQSPSFKIPDEYKDKPWAAKVTSEAELWKQLANTQELIGKKSIVPDLKTATPEDREAFYAQMRPADVSEYQFAGEPVPALKEGNAKAMMENGISATQANPVIAKYQELGQAEQEKLFDPEGFKTVMKGAFGDNWEQTTGAAYNNLKAMMSPQDQKMMEALPNPYAALIYRTLGNVDKATQNMMKRYGVKETALAHFSDPAATNNAGGDIEGKRATIRGQLAKLTSGFHTHEQKADLVKQLSDTYTNDPRAAQE